MTTNYPTGYDNPSTLPPVTPNTQINVLVVNPNNPISGNYTIINSEELTVCNTAGGSFTVSLPGSPNAGEVHVISDYNGNFATNALIVSANGNNIVNNTGLVSSVTLNIAGTVRYFIWNGSYWNIK